LHDESDDEVHDVLDEVHDELDELEQGLEIVTDPDELDELDELHKLETDELVELDELDELDEPDELLDKETVQLIVSLLLLEEASEFNPVTESNEHELEDSLCFL